MERARRKDVFNGGLHFELMCETENKHLLFSFSHNKTRITLSILSLIKKFLNFKSSQLQNGEILRFICVNHVQL